MLTENSTAAELPVLPSSDGKGAVRRVFKGDELVLPRHRSVIVQYADGPTGRELHLYCGVKEVSFDEPDLFSFGETLAKHSKFVAENAVEWGGHEWSRIRELLEQLISEGVLVHADEYGYEESAAVEMSERPSPLPPAQATEPATWFACESILAKIAGRPLELGHLELVIPIFRVAHMTLDADGRQVGEANVFPKAMRLDIPTKWRGCNYPGSRHQDVRPMNVTALKAMREHWDQMMAILLRVRAAYIERFPEARNGWTVGHLERLATVVLALPTYVLMRNDAPLPTGTLHPALSSVFRVTDGLRMTMHQMLFIPVGEPTFAPSAPMTSAEIYAYAERNYSFHSDYGVCAGPQAMIKEFFSVLVDGQLPRHGIPEMLKPEVTSALDQLPFAFDYAMLGLQSHAAIFSLWPAMTRCYEEMFEIVSSWAQEQPTSLAVAAFLKRLSSHIDRIKTATYLGSEAWRIDRETVYDDMYAQSAFGLTGKLQDVPLHAALAPAPMTKADHAALQLHSILHARFAVSGSESEHYLSRLVECFVTFLRREQAAIRVAEISQSRINTLLHRPAPTRPFTGQDVDLHNVLQGNAERRLPYLLDELQDALGIEITLEAERLEIKDTGADERSAA